MYGGRLFPSLSVSSHRSSSRGAGEVFKAAFLWGLRIPGKGYGSLTELPEVSGTGLGVLQDSQKFRAGVRKVLQYMCPRYCSTGCT